MKYIVWRNPYKSYGIYQGGYFVKWKNKLSDEFSPNWFEANRYKTLGGAVTRLGLRFDKKIKSLDDFYKFNSIDKSKLRDNKISEVLGESGNDFLFFKIGHIDMIDDSGNFVGNAGKDLLDYIKVLIKKNISESESLKKRFDSLGIESLPKEDVSSEDYLKDFLQMFN